MIIFLTICIGFQYTCFEVSQNFIILGASSGGLYMFRRKPCEFIQLLPNKVSNHSYLRNQNGENKSFGKYVIFYHITYASFNFFFFWEN